MCRKDVYGWIMEFSSDRPEGIFYYWMEAVSKKMFFLCHPHPKLTIYNLFILVPFTAVNRIYFG